MHMGVDADKDAERSVSGQDGWFPLSDVRIWLISRLSMSVPMPPVYRDVYRSSQIAKLHNAFFEAQ